MIKIFFSHAGSPYVRSKVATAPPTCVQESKPSAESCVNNHVETATHQSPDFPTSPRLRESATDLEFSFQPSKPNSMKFFFFVLK